MSAVAVRAKAERPETMAEARRWETVKNNYATLVGTCQRCSAHLAWGTQLGFERVDAQPCRPCRLILKGLPVAKANGWRTVKGRATDRPSFSLAESAVFTRQGSDGTPTEARPVASKETVLYKREAAA